MLTIAATTKAYPYRLLSTSPPVLVLQPLEMYCILVLLHLSMAAAAAARRTKSEIVLLRHEIAPITYSSVCQDTSPTLSISSAYVDTSHMGTRILCVLLLL
jgi:hypothetical protein